MVAVLFLVFMLLIPFTLKREGIVHQVDLNVILRHAGEIGAHHKLVPTLKHIDLR